MRPLCQLCGKRPARFICSRCGRQVCERCFDTTTWLCSPCLEEAAATHRVPMVPSLPIGWLLLGFLLFSVGVVLMALGAALAGSSGVIVVFPFFFMLSGVTNLMIWFVVAFLVLFLAFFLVFAFLEIRRCPWT